MVRGRKGDQFEGPQIKPVTKAQRRAANQPANAVASNLKPVKVKGVTKWVKK